MTGSVRDVLITSDKHDRIFEDARFSCGCLSNESVGDYFAKARGDGSLLIVRNNTVLIRGKISRVNIYSYTLPMRYLT